ncbi:MAG TPA: hypothetical protein VJ574_03455 [Candidatus Bathyarchaeia archaeon]|nr:hypothetical protein [Candidatus Bathyarchaeia archaeon]
MEYVGYVLIGVAAALLASGSVSLFYFQQYPGTNPQYGPYPIPLMILGVGALVSGIGALLRAKGKKKAEQVPPPPLPPPPPPL